jgi:hypothetical protein
MHRNVTLTGERQSEIAMKIEFLHAEKTEQKRDPSLRLACP